MIHIEGENDDADGIDNKRGSSKMNMDQDGGPGVGGMVIKGGLSPEEEDQGEEGKSSDDESLQDGVNDDPDALQDA